MTYLHSITEYGSKLFNVPLETFSNWRWQMAHQVSTEEQALNILGFSKEELKGFSETGSIFNVGISPYYASLIHIERASGLVDGPLTRQVMPNILELSDPLGVKDPLCEVGNSPVKEVIHLYPDRVAFCVAMLCPVYCRYCFRKRRDEDEVGLHYNRAIVDRGIEYIASMPAIRDVLITGGDPWIASDETIINLVKRLRAIPHVEIIRFGTRTPVALPYRITEDLLKKLAPYHPIWVNTHFNCLSEITDESGRALEMLANHGFPVGNQSVLLRGVNDKFSDMQDLCRGLIRKRVRPYYVLHPHLVEGTQHLRVPIREGIELMNNLRGKMSGYAIPTYILDTPSGKVAMNKNVILGFDGDDVLIENSHGEIWREKG